MGTWYNTIMLDLEQQQRYETLRAAEEVDGKIQLPNHQCFPVEKHDTLIVRNAHRHIYRLFVALLLEGKQLHGQRFGRMVVTGPDSVGKVIVY